jgi:protein subunit release factor B
MKELLFSVTASDCTWQYFCAGGKGGQHQNKTASACRCIHKESGATGESREHKSAWQNKKAAFERMAATPKMQTWLKMEAGRRMVTGEERRRREAEIANAVERQMEPKNFKYEVRRNGKWEEIAESELEVVAE